MATHGQAQPHWWYRKGRTGARVAEWTGLLNRRTSLGVPRVRIPPCPFCPLFQGVSCTSHHRRCRRQRHPNTADSGNRQQVFGQGLAKRQLPVDRCPSPAPVANRAFSPGPRSSPGGEPGVCVFPERTCSFSSFFVHLKKKCGCTRSTTGRVPGSRLR